MKNKHIKPAEHQNTNISKKLLILSVAIGFLMPEFAFSADIGSMTNKIFKWFTDVMQPVGTIIIIAVGIYFLKNLERWKEILVTCVGIIAATLLIMNAQAISQWAFGN